LGQRGLVFHRFPDDPKLKRLTPFADVPKQRKLLHDVLPEVPDATFEVLNYKPERRLAVKAVNETNRAVLKFYTPDTFAGARAKAELAMAQEAVRAPKLLGSSEHYGVMALEWLDGMLLREVLMTPDCDMKQARQVGAALANFHRQAVPLPARSPNANTVRAEHLVDYLSWLQPELSQRLDKLLGTIIPSVREFTHLVTLHGDFYSKQVLVQQSGIAFLDFDEAHSGDAAYDMGLFLAHLEADVVRGFLLPSVLENLREHFLQGYQEVTTPIPKNLLAYTVMGMLSLLPHFFRNRHPNWPELAETLLTRAEHLAWGETRAYAAPL
jgi:Ser/Thr protein kinase RdoA (MazF antagonist)